MDSYTSFAYVYDTFMDQEPYDKWADRVCSWLEKYGLEKAAPEGAVPGETVRRETGEKSCFPETADLYAEESKIVVDLGCGTGKLTELLAERGYDMIGIDLSEDMLAIAQERKEVSGSSILYTQQDIREFELYGAAGAMVSVGDSINYLLEEADLEAMFRCVFRGLLPGGVFVFDFKTIHLYRDVIGDSTIAEDRGDCAFIWDNYYDPESCVNEYVLAIFVRETDVDPADIGSLYRRFDEVHTQRGYTPAQLRKAAEKAGFVWIDLQDVDTGGDVDDQTERAMAVIRKPA